MKTLLIAAAVCLALPAGAAAKIRPYIPPGNAGANEYVESVPTPTGNKPTTNVIEAPGAGSLTPATESALVATGPDGRRAAALANATAPPTLRHRRNRQHGTTTSGSGGPPGSGGGGSIGSSSPGSAAGTVVESVFGLHGQGGAALPVILILAALALGAGRMWRRRAS